jgi:uracil-DNA glycosylase
MPKKPLNGERKTLFPRPASLEELAKAAKDCKACDLWKRGTQTVFGEGGPNVKVMFIGEQPGNQEDLEGKPFVGPAGKLLDAALDEAAIDRRKVYVTNAVKHFKWEPRGKRRIHKKLRIPTNAITHSDLIPISDSAPSRSPSERSDAGGWILVKVIGIRQRIR